jgi:cobaltochelatase CobS
MAEPTLSNTIFGQDETLKMLKLASKADIATLLIGDTGTGKTTIVKHLAELEGRDWIRFNLTGETTVDDFVGKWTLQNGETVWNDGILLQAMKQGKWLIVDEINVALPEILFVLHSLLDDDKYVVVPNNNGEVVRPEKGFRFFATMNPVDEYAGTKDLNKAFKSRFGIIAYMDYPDIKTETKIVNLKTKVGVRTAKKMVMLAHKFRQAKREDEIFYTCSTRDIMQWAEVYRKIEDLEVSFKYTILNKANGDGEKLRNIYSDTIARMSAIENESPNLLMSELENKLQEIQTQRGDLQYEMERIRRKVTDNIMADLKEKLGVAAQLINEKEVSEKAQKEESKVEAV